MLYSHSPAHCVDFPSGTIKFELELILLSCVFIKCTGSAPGGLVKERIVTEGPCLGSEQAVIVGSFLELEMEDVFCMLEVNSSLATFFILSGHLYLRRSAWVFSLFCLCCFLLHVCPPKKSHHVGL